MTYKERVEGVLDGYKNYVVESMTLQATDVSNKKINKHQATQQIINLIESVIPKEKTITPSTHSTVRSQLKIMKKQCFEGGYNACISDIKSKLIDGENNKG